MLKSLVDAHKNNRSKNNNRLGSRFRNAQKNQIPRRGRLGPVPLGGPAGGAVVGDRGLDRDPGALGAAALAAAHVLGSGLITRR